MEVEARRSKAIGLALVQEEVNLKVIRNSITFLKNQIINEIASIIKQSKQSIQKDHSWASGLLKTLLK
jgi:hypothetical protein